MTRREDPIHRAIFQYLQVQYPRAAIHHSPNELDLAGNERARIIAQNRRKALGMCPGWPDLEMLHDGQFYAFEVKTKDGRQTKAQKDAQAVIEASGGRYAVVRSIDDVIEKMEGWREEDA